VRINSATSRQPLCRTGVIEAGARDRLVAAQAYWPLTPANAASGPARAPPTPRSRPVKRDSQQMAAMLVSMAKVWGKMETTDGKK